MEERIERLRALVDDVHVWEKPEVAFDACGKSQEALESLGVTVVHHDTPNNDKLLPLVRSAPAWRAITTTQANDASMVSSRKLELGEQIDHEEAFCSLKALTKFPYENVEPSVRECVVEEYFTKDKLYRQIPWDIFYLYPPYEISRQALLLVPLYQTIGYQMSFPLINMLSPRYLGCSTDFKSAEMLRSSVPSASYQLDTETYDEDEPTLAASENFRAMLEPLFEADKQKKNLAKEKKKRARTELQGSWRRSIERVQTYLGIWQSDVDNRETTRGGSELHNQHPYEITGAHIQDHSVVFICVDVEAYERNHNIITEIGIATLDTTDISNIAPEENGQQWRSAIRAKHFRIKEYGHLLNKEFVQGCPDRFEFGSSEWISIKEAAYEVAKCFKPPYFEKVDRNEGEITFADVDVHQDPTATDKWAQLDANTTLSISDNTASPSKRNIVLVGHDLGTDINYLKKLGYDVRNLSNICDRIDTATMYQGLRQDIQPRSLGGVLSDLGIAGWYLHNAGNDAVYTLQAMLGIALRDLVERSGS